MRAINPFSYFVDYASQLRGFGGDRPSPDPQYCFHTRYEVVRPGRAIYALKLLGARATQGELTVRVHAFKPEFGGAPSLAAGNRLSLDFGTRQDLAVTVPFHAIKGVEYALYGFFTEPTDLSVAEVAVELDEPEDEEDILIEAPLSTLADPATTQESGPATGLIHIGAVRRDSPVSQDCTWRQLEPTGTLPERMARWRETVCMAALTAYGVDLPGLDGWVVGTVSPAMEQAMLAKPFTLLFRNEAPGRESGEFADVILWPEGPPPHADASARWGALHDWLDRIKMGGCALVGLTYAAGETSAEALSRNEIRQWVFRLIGMGYSVAPLAFADDRDLAVDEAGMASFCLIVRRQ